MHRFLASAVLLVVLAIVPSVDAYPCNYEDANVSAGVNYQAVLDGEIPVCSLSTHILPDAISDGASAWNGAISTPIFGWELVCSTYGVGFADTNEGGCWGAPACLFKGPGGEERVSLVIYVEPMTSDYSFRDQKSLAAHELGHTLGFDDTLGCVSIMDDTPCIYDLGGPTSVDADNYQKAYWVEAVTNLTGSSPSPGAVSLTWSPVNSAGEELCNEKEFSVWRYNPSTGWYDVPVTTADKNSTGVSFGGQPCGLQEYAVVSMTNALPWPFGGYATIPVIVPGPNYDSDGDGVADCADNCPAIANAGQEDADGDGIGNVCELDVDCDGHLDIVDFVMILRHIFGSADLYPGYECPPPPGYLSGPRASAYVAYPGGGDMEDAMMVLECIVGFHNIVCPQQGEEG